MPFETRKTRIEEVCLENEELILNMLSQRCGLKDVKKLFGMGKWEGSIKYKSWLCGIAL